MLTKTQAVRVTPRKESEVDWLTRASGLCRVCVALWTHTREPGSDPALGPTMARASFALREASMQIRADPSRRGVVCAKSAEVCLTCAMICEALAAANPLYGRSARLFRDAAGWCIGEAMGG